MFNLRRQKPPVDPDEQQFEAGGWDDNDPLAELSRLLGDDLRGAGQGAPHGHAQADDAYDDDRYREADGYLTEEDYIAAHEAEMAEAGWYEDEAAEPYAAEPYAAEPYAYEDEGHAAAGYPAGAGYEAAADDGYGAIPPTTMPPTRT
ncbi:hypothetical protein [Methylobrevis pamukkalensis]|uniref:Uncharacterized protein n=1 Tax=Methylobrevis pamukkalensis TaxID=1439726 RepID=A0A1E3GYJ4_9HYPH|nr:hypothetical protein [Methylobrevis pamukkalensis]ODN68995.1 hypothetical protein A6302_03719 [Methylobrevis pamukkalensis]